MNNVAPAHIYSNYNPDSLESSKWPQRQWLPLVPEWKISLELINNRNELLRSKLKPMWAVSCYQNTICKIKFAGLCDSQSNKFILILKSDQFDKVTDNKQNSHEKTHTWAHACFTPTRIEMRTLRDFLWHTHADATEQVSGHSERVACEPQGRTKSCRDKRIRISVLRGGRELM